MNFNLSSYGEKTPKIVKLVCDFILGATLAVNTYIMTAPETVINPDKKGVVIWSLGLVAAVVTFTGRFFGESK